MESGSLLSWYSPAGGSGNCGEISSEESDPESKGSEVGGKNSGGRGAVRSVQHIFKDYLSMKTIMKWGTGEGHLPPFLHDVISFSATPHAQIARVLPFTA